MSSRTAWIVAGEFILPLRRAVRDDFIVDGFWCLGGEDHAEPIFARPSGKRESALLAGGHLLRRRKILSLVDRVKPSGRAWMFFDPGEAKLEPLETAQVNEARLRSVGCVVD